jgi:S-adenosylmethionine-diacylglycerol 3-amino-3-carboxypropyl transferase
MAATAVDRSRNIAVKAAVHQHEKLSKAGLLERAFTFAFKGLVYAQIWEDPVVDMEALAITPDCHIVTIASGGCNALSYLTANPAAVTAVDLNTAHVAFNSLKHAAVRHLPDYASFHRFFAQADAKENVRAYKVHIRPFLDETTRNYWEGRDMIGRRRIGGFAKNIYKRGLLGNFIGTAHLLAKLYRVDLKDLLAAQNIDEQREIFETKLAPIFDKRFVRWLIDQPASLFGLGIPPAQYDALAADDPDGIGAVLRGRLEKLACDFDVKDNYFAQQAFGRGYAQGAGASLPPYLQEANYADLVARIGRVEILHANFTTHLSECPPQSRDRYLLLDAQDWMTDAQLTELWTQITRTARPGARVVFRTAAAPTLLPGRVPQAILDQWDYRAKASLDYTQRDRSSIYGGVHLYVLKDAHLAGQ